MRDPRFVMVALGGNAFQSKGSRGTVEEYWNNAARAAHAIVDMVEEGYRVVVTHGNGPQVGTVLEWMEAGKHRAPPMTMDIAGAMTQGWLGYILMQCIRNELVRRGLLGTKVRGVVAIVNQVLVDPRDPAFTNPTKFVGPYYSEEEARRLMEEKGWVMKPDPRGGWRRVVPSPDPIDNVEKEAVKTLVENGWIVIASGGGGIPVVDAGKGILRGVEAVIDKDLAAERLATALGCGMLIILTDVDRVYIDFGKPTARPLDVVTVSELEKYYAEGHFPPGSMGPKVLAAIRFIKNGGLEARIGHLHRAREVVKGLSGTRIVPG